MVLDLAPHHAEGVVASMMVDVNSAEACGASSWDPLLVGIIVDHDSSPSLADALFTVETRSISSQEATQHSLHSLLAHTHSHTYPDTTRHLVYSPLCPREVLLRSVPVQRDLCHCCCTQYIYMHSLIQLCSQLDFPCPSLHPTAKITNTR